MRIHVGGTKSAPYVDVAGDKKDNPADIANAFILLVNMITPVPVKRIRRKSNTAKQEVTG